MSSTLDFSAWQSAFPYLGTNPTSSHTPTLGDYNSAYKQFAMNNYTNSWRDLIVTLTKRG